jgi:hypothetical protein
VVVNQAPAPPTVVIQQPANHNGCSEATSALVGLQLLFWDAINRTLDRRQADMTEAVVCMQLMMQDTVGRAIEQTGAATSQAVRELGAHLAQSLGVAVRDASGAAAGAMGHLEREIVQAIDRSAATTAEAMSRLNLNVVLPPPVVLPEPPAPPRPPPPPEPVPPQVVFVERVVTPARAPPAAAPVPPSRPDVALYFPTPQRFVSDTAVQTRVTPASFSSSDESSLSASSLEGLLVPSTAKLMANAPPFPSDLSEGEVYVPPHFTDTDGAHSEGEVRLSSCMRCPACRCCACVLSQCPGVRAAHHCRHAATADGCSSRRRWCRWRGARRRRNVSGRVLERQCGFSGGVLAGAGRVAWP